VLATARWPVVPVQPVTALRTSVSRAGAEIRGANI